MHTTNKHFLATFGSARSSLPAGDRSKAEGHAGRSDGRRCRVENEESVTRSRPTHSHSTAMDLPHQPCHFTRTTACHANLRRRGGQALLVCRLCTKGSAAAGPSLTVHDAAGSWRRA